MSNWQERNLSLFVKGLVDDARAMGQQADVDVSYTILTECKASSTKLCRLKAGLTWVKLRTVTGGRATARPPVKLLDTISSCFFYFFNS